MAWEESRNPPESRHPQTCLFALTLTLSPSSTLPFSPILVSHLPSSASSSSSHSQLRHPTLWHLSPHLSSPHSSLIPPTYPPSSSSRVSSSSSSFSWSCSCCCSWYSSSPSPPPHLFVSFVLLLIHHPTLPWFFSITYSSTTTINIRMRSFSQEVLVFCGDLHRKTLWVDMDVERDAGAAMRRRQRRQWSRFTRNLKF